MVFWAWESMLSATGGGMNRGMNLGMNLGMNRPLRGMFPWRPKYTTCRTLDALFAKSLYITTLPYTHTCMHTDSRKLDSRIPLRAFTAGLQRGRDQSQVHQHLLEPRPLGGILIPAPDNHFPIPFGCVVWERSERRPLALHTQKLLVFMYLYVCTCRVICARAGGLCLRLLFVCDSRACVAAHMH